MEGMLGYDDKKTKKICKRNLSCCRVVLAVDLGSQTMFNHAKQQFAQEFSVKP